VLTSTFSAVYRTAWKKEKAKFEAALRENLNTHAFNALDEFFTGVLISP
jgi:hypothetical protein